MDSMATQIDEFCRARAQMYRMLASLYFKELTEEEIENLSGLDFGSLDVGDELISAGATDMRRFLARTHIDRRQELAVDYAHSMLAAGSYTDRRATPYESVFTSDTGLLMQEARDDVYRLFCQERLGVTPGLNIPEDHLAFEFEYMALMCDRMADAVGKADLAEAQRILGVQREFHVKHLLNWIDVYCDCLERVAQTTFYRGLSKMTRGWVHLEESSIEDAHALLDDIREDADDDKA